MSVAIFESIEWRSVTENPSELISEEWMLVTPGTIDRWNTMTASWGGFGHFWGMDSVIVFVRPSRYTYVLMEESEGFTLSFLGEPGRRALDVCGAVSGRDTDKARDADIRPRGFSAGRGASSRAGAAQVPERVGFEEARLVVSCRKAYSQDLDPASFIDPSIARNYPLGDVHRLYIGAVEGAWKRG
jgi:flavin reductase (DIM6/NTAB) family NADH-FMN oxidoreductase RutF